jgi:hypothetical protein
VVRTPDQWLENSRWLPPQSVMPIDRLTGLFSEVNVIARLRSLARVTGCLESVMSIRLALKITVAVSPSALATRDLTLSPLIWYTRPAWRRVTCRFPWKLAVFLSNFTWNWKSVLSPGSPAYRPAEWLLTSHPLPFTAVLSFTRETVMTASSAASLRV